MNLTEEYFLEEFQKSYQIPFNKNCELCDVNKELKYPLLPWIVGSKYFETKERIMIIGKPHRGIPGKLLKSMIINPNSKENNCLEWMKNECTWAYWSYTKEILKRIYPNQDVWDFVSFTNIIKCTNTADDGTHIDKTTWKMANQCIKENGIIFKEIEKLKPRTIVFYIFSLFNDFLNEFPFSNEIIDEKSKHNKITCGQKQLPWWERTIKTNWDSKVRDLVTGHPQRMQKKEFVEKIVAWIQNKNVV